MRRYMYEPIPEVFWAAEILAHAAVAHSSGNHNDAVRLLHQANMPAILDWQKPIQWTQPFRKLEGEPATMPRDERPTPRMPTTATRQLVLERDGYHCRFCGMPVIASETRKAIMSAYGEDVLPWGSTFETCHAAFQCLWLQFDHILPNARGGTSDADNIAITCAPCNYGRMNFSLNEVGVSHPLASERPVRWAGYDGWDGLQAFNVRHGDQPRTIRGEMVL